jgi:hypothetical protein
MIAQHEIDRQFKSIRDVLKVLGKTVRFSNITPDQDDIRADISHFLNELVNACVTGKIQM